MTAYILCLILFSLGVYCAVSKRNLIKIIVGVAIAEYAVNLMFVLVGYRMGGVPPIFAPGGAQGAMVDPLPHALVLTSIVIGLATTALLAAIAMRIYRKYGTYDVNEIRELRG
jgi:multisubunit Na+/H+ antiporter MnhC subunit